MSIHNHAWLFFETCRKFDKFACQYLKVYEYFYLYNFWPFESLETSEVQWSQEKKKLKKIIWSVNIPLVNILMHNLEQNIGILYNTRKFVFGDQIP